MKRFILGVLVSMALLSCSNDLEIYTDPVELPFVYGVAVSNQDVHYVKVTKTFQKLAKDVTYDDLYYHDDSIKVYIEELRNGTLTEEFIGVPVETFDKDSGEFPFPQNKYYKFTGATLKTSTSANKYTYSIRVELNSGTIIRNNSHFQLNNNVILESPKLNANRRENPISFVNNVGDNKPFRLDWKQVGGGRESVDYIFHIEKTNKSTGNIDTLTLPVNAYSGVPVNDVEVSLLEITDLYSAFSGHLEKGSNISHRLLNVEQDVTEVKCYGVEVDIWSSSKDLSTYNSVLFSQDGISQDKPNFTNLDNSLGIFTSKSNLNYGLDKKNFYLTIDVLDSLACSSRLFDYNFAKYYFNSSGQLESSVETDRCF